MAGKKSSKESMEAEYEACECGPCRCVHHKVIPFLSLLFGLVFLLNALNYFITDSMLAIAWPVLVVLGSLQWLIGDKICNCCMC